ncbi:CAZyme family GT25 [Penicillium roqueforti]|nr:CAZyme family GT25 [Penicillium roqueforti]
MGRKQVLSIPAVRNLAGLAAFLIILLNLFGNYLFGSLKYTAQRSLLKANLEPLNETLGFERIAVVSSGTSWRLHGLVEATEFTNLYIDVPSQPVWTDTEVDEFRGYRVHGRHGELGPGQARCWLGHLNIWRQMLLQKWSTALIMEDDADWDITIKQQLLRVAPLIQEVTGATDWSSPYGNSWDLLWLGHCGDYIPLQLASFVDETLPGSPMYRENDGRFTEFPHQQRMVHMSVGPICTYAYALTASAASKLYQLSSSGMDKLITTHLREWCQEGFLKCVTVNPELFHHHKQAGEISSEIGVVEGWENRSAVDFTPNIRYSARCSSKKKRPAACQLEFDPV